MIYKHLPFVHFPIAYVDSKVLGSIYVEAISYKNNRVEYLRLNSEILWLIWTCDRTCNSQSKWWIFYIRLAPVIHQKRNLCCQNNLQQKLISKSRKKKNERMMKSSSERAERHFLLNSTMVWSSCVHTNQPHLAYVIAAEDRTVMYKKYTSWAFNNPPKAKPVTLVLRGCVVSFAVLVVNSHFIGV